MPMFRRDRSREHGPADRPASAVASTPAAPEPDWRSFDDVAASYSRSLELKTEPPAADLIELLQVPAGARVLDVGTGTGAAARHAAAAAGEAGLVVGVDVSVGMVREAASRDAGPRYVASTSIDLPFRDGTFDRLAGAFVISFFTDYRTALFELLRVLKPGGRAGFTAWAEGEDQDDFRRAWAEVQEEFAEAEVLADAHREAVPWEELFSNKDRLKDALHDAGLRDIWIERRSYRVETTAEQYLTGREITPTGRFLHEMLGDELWPSLQRRAREVFASRFPERFTDFHEALLAVGHKP